MLNFLFDIIYVYFFFSVIYLLVFAIAGNFRLKEILSLDTQKLRFSVLLPAYKEDSVIVQTAAQALKQKYPKDLFDVVVIADSLKPETLRELEKLPITLISVEFELSTKAKAINKTLQQLPDKYDAVVVLDADNVMADDFLTRVSQPLFSDYKAVQGHRVAKNIDTPMAKLDTLSEEINNQIFRKGHCAIGLSSALIGSGMVFEYKIFKQIMAKIDAVSGFDKELEFLMFRNKIKIAYLNDALVYDEKVQKADVFVGQRRRWLAAQYFYFKKFFLEGCKQFILERNFDFFDKAIQMALPPRVLLLGMLFIFSSIFSLKDIVLARSLTVDSYQWIFLFGLTILSLLISVPKKLYNWKILKAVLYLPKGFILMMCSLLRIKNANKKFIHTQHGV